MKTANEIERQKEKEKAQKFLLELKQQIQEEKAQKSLKETQQQIQEENDKAHINSRTTKGKQVTRTRKVQQRKRKQFSCSRQKETTRTGKTLS